jgi:hypothetical protein
MLCPSVLLLLATALLAGTVQYNNDAAGRLTKVDYGDGRTITYTHASASLPTLSFEANQGQIDSRYQFLARRGNHSVAVAAHEAQCVQWKSPSKTEARTRISALAAQTSFESAARGGGSLMSGLSARLVGLDGASCKQN